MLRCCSSRSVLGLRDLHASDIAGPNRLRRYKFLAAILAVGVVLSSPVAAHVASGAEDGGVAGHLATRLPAVEPPPPLWREVWIGADATSRSWLVYSGITIAPYSAIHDDGLRFRFASGYGQYRWQGKTTTADGARARGSGDFTYVDGLVGYLKRYGPLTAKAFAGLTLSSHSIRDLVLPNGTGFDPGEEPISGGEIGVKLALELWLNLGSRAWSSLDVNWTDAHDTFAARWRGAYRLWPSVSLGVEAIVNGDRRFDVGTLVEAPELERLNRRGGAFIRYEWFGGELSLAGGVSSSSDEGTRPYATFNWIIQF